MDKCTRAPTFDFLVVVVQPNALNTPNTFVSAVVVVVIDAY